MLARALLEARLIACANLIDGTTSLYRWEGEMREESECILIAKTTAARLEEITAKVKALHGYECPCIVAMPITGGNADFLSWVSDEVKI